jgi:pyruvate dehydrogenase E2 component (dihydrolipoamide acetyltransferase)
MEEGTIAKWHKKIGDKVQADELLLEVATDKATVEYNVLDEGFLRKILIEEGKSALVNQPIAIFSATAEESIEGYQPEGVSPEKEPEAPPEQAKPGKSAAAPAPQQKVGPSLQQPAFTPEQPLENYDFEFPAEDGASRKIASPLAKKLAKEKGVDLSTVKGSGPHGRVVSRDLDLGQPDQIVAFGRNDVPDVAPGTFEEIPLTPMRKAVGSRLQQSKSYIPHFYVRQEVDAAPMFDIRVQLKDGNIKLSFNDFVMRAVALALRAHPEVNSGFNSVTQSLISFKTIDISVAVSVDGGLITPIIRHADFKNLGQIAVEVNELAGRAKAGKLEPHEYKGGSFTVSNLGMFGISDFAAIINPPQAAILAIGGIEECARVKNGVISAGKKMNLVLSVDHRVVDGAEAAKFIKTVQKYLESPAILLV